MRPVGNGTECRARAEPFGLGKEGHKRDEAAIAPAVDPDPLGIYSELGLQVARSVDVILQVAAAHVAVDRRTPVAPVTGRATVVDVQNDVALARQQVVEHVLPRIARPPLMDVMQVAGAMNENHSRAIRLSPDVGRTVDPGRHADAVRGGNANDLRFDPVV